MKILKTGRTLGFHLVFVLLFAHSAHAAEFSLVPPGSTWKYLDNGSNQGTAWRQPSFNDGSWLTGQAQLGYGDGDEQKVVSFGSDPNNKYITTYFRLSFHVANPSIYTGLILRLLKDDGAVVYLNGTEIHRVNMPGGSISHTTLASTALGSPDENTFFSTSLCNTLVTGNNVLAVEIHQANGTSTDLSFDLELKATDSATVTRGPYLQLGTSTSMVVKWRTNVCSNGRVRYGTDPLNLNNFKDELTSTTEHEVELTGLLASTKYYYTIGTTTQILAGDSTYFFSTSPPAGTAVPTRIWVLGDSGTADQNAINVREAYLNYPGYKYTNLWLMLGDNAYETGTDAEYQAAVFDMYPSLLRQSPLWPTLGNHDGATANSSGQSGPYYDIFKLPRQGEAGGLPSGTEAYYSFDYGNIHFICLESFETNRATNGAMMTWLQNDVNATNKDWIIAFWHHPPYSKGSHNSDLELELMEMRQNALPILEQAGVDLVLTGHSHSYERSFLIDGHYGTTATFTNSMKKDGGSGRENGTGSYKKSTSGLAPHEGAVYAVAGSSGQISGGPLNHPAMYISLNSLGSMVLDVNGKRLDAIFLNSSQAVADYFTIVKGNPEITISDASLAEGNSGTSTLEFDVTVSYSTAQSITIQYQTGDDTATNADNDYEPVSSSITIPAGQTHKTISIVVNGDTKFEDNETFFVNLNSTTNGTIVDAQATGTITNDDAGPAIAIANTTVTEPSNGTGTVNANFVVTVTPVSGAEIQVHYQTANDTALAGQDYNALPSSPLTIPAGASQGTITVQVLGDGRAEAAEAYFVNLSSPVGATITDAQAKGTINNRKPGLSINDVTQNEGNTGTPNAVFTVTPAFLYDAPISVSYTTQDGTAVQPSDYATTNGTLNIPAQNASGTISVPVVGDPATEPNETYTVKLTSPVNATLTDSTGTGTIVNDDGSLPVLSVNDVSVTEGNSGTLNATFTITQSSVSGANTTVKFITADGSAKKPGDYVNKSITVTIPQGSTQVQVNVTVNGDTLFEANETFKVKLSNAVGATIADLEGIGTIQNDDAPPSVSINDMSVIETGTTQIVIFTVTLSQVSGASTTIKASTADGTAVKPSDYAAFSNKSLTIPAGALSKTFNVTVNGDAVAEAQESFFINLSSPVNATIGDGQGTCTIQDND